MCQAGLLGFTCLTGGGFIFGKGAQMVVVFFVVPLVVVVVVVVVLILF